MKSFIKITFVFIPFFVTAHEVNKKDFYCLESEVNDLRLIMNLNMILDAPKFASIIPNIQVEIDKKDLRIKTLEKQTKGQKDFHFCQLKSSILIETNFSIMRLVGNFKRNKK